MILLFVIFFILSTIQPWKLKTATLRVSKIGSFIPRHMRVMTGVNANEFSPNLVCALILSRSDLGLLMGKFSLF